MPQVPQYLDGQLVGTVDVPDSITNRDETHGQLTQAMTALGTAWTAMNTIANGSGTFATNTVRDQAIRDIAAALRLAIRTERRLLRFTLNDFAGSD